MSALGFIPDGFSETGVLNESPGLYPRLEFTFRRMTCQEYAEYLHTIANLTEPQVWQLIAAHTAKRILSWDLADAKGEKVLVSEDVCRRLVRTLAVWLWQVINGERGPDSLIGQPSSDATADFSAALEAARSGKPLSAVREEAQKGN